MPGRGKGMCKRLKMAGDKVGGKGSRRQEESRGNAWGPEKKLRVPSHHLATQSGLF